MRSYRFLILLPIIFTALLSGCSLLAVGIEGIKYPQDTAVLIDDTPYLINTFKCAQIAAIRENGRLVCYDLEGRRSAQIPPASEGYRNRLKEKFGIEWASPEHQAELFKWFHGGGKEAFEKSVADVLSVSMQLGQSVSGLSKSLEKSRKIKIQEAKIRQKGIEYHISGDMAALQAHQFNVVQWRLDNADYFRNQAIATNYSPIDVMGAKRTQDKSSEEIYIRHEESQKSASPSRSTRLICMAMEGAEVFAADGVFLGTISSRHESDSIFNESGKHGGSYSSTSIWNEHGSYGGRHADMSPFNSFASSPPLIFKDGVQVATLTVSSDGVAGVNPLVIGSCWP